MTSHDTAMLSVIMHAGPGDQSAAAAQKLDVAIRAIRGQSFANFEFLILVDAGCDATTNVVLGHALDDRRIRIVRNEGHSALSGLNHLHNLARTRFIARADVNDIAAPDRLERQMDLAIDNPDHGVIGTGCIQLGPQDHTLVRRDPAQPSLAFPREALSPAHQQPVGDDRIRAGLRAGPPMDAATLLYAREAVLAVGGYRPALGHAAGYDLLLRLSGHTRMAKLPQGLVSRERAEARDESETVARASQNAIAWLCHSQRLAGRLDPVETLGRLPTTLELDTLFGRGAGDLVRRRVVEASLHAPQALAAEGWEMLKTYASRHQDNPRMWRLAARMLVSGKPLRAGQLGMTLMNA